MRLSTSLAIEINDKGKIRKIPAEDSLRAVANAGYRYCDVPIYSYVQMDGPLADSDWEKWAHSFRDLAESLDIKFSQSHAYFYPNIFLDKNGTYSEPNFDEYHRRSVLASEIFGVKWMVMHPSTWPGNDGNADYAKSFGYNKDYFSRWGDLASKHKVGIAIENMWHPVDRKKGYCVVSEELVELVDALNDPLIQICVDVGHIPLYELNIVSYIRSVGGRLKATHIHDNHGSSRGMGHEADEHIMPFQGSIQWEEVMDVLKNVNYEQDFTFEVHQLTKYFPANLIAPLIDFSYILGEYLFSL